MTPITTYKQWIEEEIRKQKFGKEPKSLYEPIHYLMALGGKRLRPMLVLLAYSLFKKNVRSIVKYAVAVEAFHNFTLMHDDIMDNAPLRRSHVTVHKKWNVNTAILSGDVMLVKVYAMFLSLPPEILKNVLKAFNTCATEVCEGQQWDMEFEKFNSTTEQQYLNMVRQKTAVLLGFSLELGAMLAGASQADCKALREFGINIGIGFQLKDDLLDAFADPKKFGKQVGGDIISNKKTYLLIKALENADAAQRKNLTHWIGVKKFNKKVKVDAVKNIYNQLNLESIAAKKMQDYFNKGIKSLSQVEGASSSTDTLKRFAEELISRQH